MDETVIAACEAWSPKCPVSLARRCASTSDQVPHRTVRLTVPWHPRLVGEIRRCMQDTWSMFEHVFPVEFRSLVLDVAVSNAAPHWLHVLRRNNYG